MAYFARAFPGVDQLTCPAWYRQALLDGLPTALAKEAVDRVRYQLEHMDTIELADTLELAGFSRAEASRIAMARKQKSHTGE